MSRYSIASAGAVLFALSCGLAISAEPAAKPADQIIGKWQGEAKLPFEGKEHVLKIAFEFGKDGAFKMTRVAVPQLKKLDPKLAKDEVVTGKYSFVTESEIEVVAKVDGKEDKHRAKVTVTKDELTVTPVEHPEQPMTFKRVKE